MRNFNCTVILLFWGLGISQVNAQSIIVMTYNIRLDLASDGENDWTHRKAFSRHRCNFARQIYLVYRKPCRTR